MLTVENKERQLAALVDELRAENRLLQEQNQILLEQVAHLSKHIFGRKSERLQPGQLDLFRSGKLPEACANFEGEIRKGKRPGKKTGGHGRGSLPAHLERVVQHLDLPKEECVCSVCNEAMGKIGEEVTERAHFVPATFLVRRYVRSKYACPNGHEVKTADLPDGVALGIQVRRLGARSRGSGEI